MKPFDQLRTPSTGWPPGSGMAMYAGRFWLSEPRPYVIHEPSDGRPGCDFPVFMNQIDDSWPLISVCIERTTQMSSTILAVCGNSSDSSVPQWPCFAKRNGLPINFLLAALTKLKVTSPEYSVPLYFVNNGLGSVRSMCGGPPCMKSEIIARACGGQAGCFGLRSK